MSFQTVLDALQTTIVGATGFSVDQVAIGKVHQFTHGETPIAVIQITPKLNLQRESMGGGHLHIWNIDVEVGAQYRDATTGPTNLALAWQAVLDQICKYPNLQQGAGSFVREAHVERAVLEPLLFDIGSLHFAKVMMTVSVTEQVTVVEAE